MIIVRCARTAGLRASDAIIQYSTPRVFDDSLRDTDSFSDACDGTESISLQCILDLLSPLFSVLEHTRARVSLYPKVV